MDQAPPEPPQHAPNLVYNLEVQILYSVNDGFHGFVRGGENQPQQGEPYHGPTISEQLGLSLQYDEDGFHAVIVPHRPPPHTA